MLGSTMKYLKSLTPTQTALSATVEARPVRKAEEPKQTKMAGFMGVQNLGEKQSRRSKSAGALGVRN